jgi:hypothetical protein
MRTRLDAIDTAASKELEARAIVGHRWWTLDELAASDEVIYPDGLAELVRRLLPSGRSTT